MTAPPRTVIERDALAMAARGRPVVALHWLHNGVCSCKDGAACESAGKHPLWHKDDLPNGYHDATTDPEKIRRWWDRWQRANVGVVTGAASGIVIIDCDQRNGGDETLRDLEQKHGRLPEGPRVLSGGGGAHYYFNHPGGIVSKQLLGPGLELLGDGQLAVAPHSWHASGKPYQWEMDTEELPLPDLPPWVRVSRKDTVSYTARQTPPRELQVYLRELERLLGRPKAAGTWTLFPCAFHPEKHPSFGVAPSGYSTCFGCGEGGWPNQVLRRLKSPIGNFVSETVAVERKSVMDALENEGHPLAEKVRRCGEEWTYYKCDQKAHPIAYPRETCKSGFDPRCRRKGLAAHLAQKHAVFERWRSPIGFLLTPPAVRSRDELRQQITTLLDSLRALSDRVPGIKDIVRATRPVCNDGAITAVHCVVMDDPGERGAVLIKMALRGLCDVAFQGSVDACDWLFRVGSGFDFTSSADLLALMEAFKGIPICRGWGESKAAIGGMMRGKKVGNLKCPVKDCTGQLQEIGRGRADCVDLVSGAGYFTWRAPP